ncbi:YqjF family protein [Kitasatospora sp. NPDC096147]|uniref:YqjF family protein n=1 Tax=Kitasatospora sp. NPDC096147 TaxID=3364093 RepID=UPI00380F1D8C
MAVLEPVTPHPPRTVGPTLLTQSWLDLTFVHWAVEPALVAPLLPAGTRPDEFEGKTYVGLVAFRMDRVGWLNLPGVPYFGSFPETNVRLYSVDAEGRRGVVFRSLEATRLAPVLAARLGFKLPYVWARMTVEHARGTIRYTSRRRWPGPVGARCRLRAEIGGRITEPTALEHFLTARWGLHNTVGGRLRYLPNIHPRWPLHRARLLDLDEDLLSAAGLPGVGGEPDSVLYSPGVPVRFGRPARYGAPTRYGAPARFGSPAR